MSDEINEAYFLCTCSKSGTCPMHLAELDFGLEKNEKLFPLTKPKTVSAERDVEGTVPSSWFLELKEEVARLTTERDNAVKESTLWNQRAREALTENERLEQEAHNFTVLLRAAEIERERLVAVEEFVRKVDYALGEWNRIAGGIGEKEALRKIEDARAALAPQADAAGGGE